MAKRKWIQLLDADGEPLGSKTTMALDDSDEDVAMLKIGTKKLFGKSLLYGIAPTALQIPRAQPAQRFRTMESQPRPTEYKWVKLVDVDGNSLDKVSVVPVSVADVATLKLELKKLYGDTVLQDIEHTSLGVFTNSTAKGVEPELAPTDSVSEIGNDFADPIIMQVPRASASIPAAVPAPEVPHVLRERFPPPPLPQMNVLANLDDFRAECTKLATLKTGETHNIPQIHAFMEPLGGCSRDGKLYWREEEHQLSSILRSGLLGGDSELPRKRIILKGSPGVGKSTMLCLLAFYVALVGKKNVLVVRKLKGDTPRYCVFFLRSHEDGRVEWFQWERCQQEQANNLLSNTTIRKDLETVRMLDGFAFSTLCFSQTTFHLLATSQEANPKSEEFAYISQFLFPSWHRDDLFRLGKSLYNWKEVDVDPDTGEDTGMVTRFYFSGGNVEEFTRDSILSIRERTLVSARDVDRPSRLLYSASLWPAGGKNSDRLRRIYVDPAELTTQEAYRRSMGWRQVVDSEFAVSLLRDTLPSRGVLYLFQWASLSGSAYASLTRLLFEILVERLASGNDMRLITTTYEPASPSSPRSTRVLVKPGEAVRSGENEGDCDAELVRWSRSPECSNWHPAYGQYPTIDGVVKLASGGLAYLQVAISDQRPVDASKIASLHARLEAEGAKEKPLFIFVCPTSNAARVFAATTRADALQLQEVCDICVGYCRDENATSPMEFSWSDELLR